MDNALFCLCSLRITVARGLEDDEIQSEDGDGDEENESESSEEESDDSEVEYSIEPSSIPLFSQTDEDHPFFDDVPMKQLDFDALTSYLQLRYEEIHGKRWGNNNNEMSLSQSTVNTDEDGDVEMKESQKRRNSVILSQETVEKKENENRQMHFLDDTIMSNLETQRGYYYLDFHSKLGVLSLLLEDALATPRFNEIVKRQMKASSEAMKIQKTNHDNLSSWLREEKAKLKTMRTRIHVQRQRIRATSNALNIASDTGENKVSPFSPFLTPFTTQKLTPPCLLWKA